MVEEKQLKKISPITIYVLGSELDIIERAKKVCGVRSRSTFILSAALEKANKVINQNE